MAAETRRLQPWLWKGRDICKSVTLILLKGLMGILESRAIYTLASGKHSLSTADTTKVEEILNAPRQIVMFALVKSTIPRSDL